MNLPVHLPQSPNHPLTHSPERHSPTHPLTDSPDHAALAALTDAQRDAVRWRHRVVSDWLTYRDNAQRRGQTAGRAMVNYLSGLPDEPYARPALSTLQRWVRKYQRGGLAGLLETRGRPAGDEPSAHPEALCLFRGYYFDPRRWSVKMCYDIVADHCRKNGWSWPSLRAIQQRVSEDLPPPVADYYRLGKKRWERKHAPRIHRAVDHIRPNEHWDGDHHQCDFLIMHEGKPVRPWLTAWRDFRSRKLVGYVLCLSPNSDTILAAFRLAVREYGAPREITIDNGRDYRAAGVAGGKRYKPRVDEERVGGLMAQLGIVVHFARPFEPQSKPIERAFGTLCERFSKTFASYCGGSPDQRPETLYADIRAGKVEIVALDEARRYLAQCVEQWYHNQPHSGEGMQGADGRDRTPNQVFEAEDPIARRTAPDAVLDQLLMRTETVRVTRNGVRYRGVNYGVWNDELGLLQGQQVVLRIDPADASQVLVCDLAGRALTTARNDRITGATHDDVRQAAKLRGRRAKAVRAARGAMSEMSLTSTEDIIAAQARNAQARVAQAAGGEVEPADRNVELLPGTGSISLGHVSQADPPSSGIFRLEDESVEEDAGPSMFVLERGEDDQPVDNRDLDWLRPADE